MSSLYLNSMANYNEHTIEDINMAVFKKFNLGLPDNSQLHFAEWNYNSNYIAVGGGQGVMKVVKIGVDLNPDKTPNVLHVNQTLEGHNATVINATWNENNQKLTTSDTSGLIIVWGIFNEQWFEEMINNRNKSVVVGICWNVDGTKIAIAYADGSVIVGTIEGNRIWNKELDVQLAACEWAPENDMLIFGTAEGKVTVYDDAGNHHLDINMVCLESVELEQALAKDPQREEIICIQYWSPCLKSKAVTDEIERERQREMEAEREKLTSTAIFINHPKIQPRDPYDDNRTPEPMQPIPPDRPKLFVAYARGLLQLMRGLADPEPVVVRLPDFRITGAKWSPNGAFVAVCGYDLTQEENCQATILFLTAYGQVNGYFKLAEFVKVTGISWESTGLRMTISVDGTLLIGTIKPTFKWGAMDETFVYVFQKEELNNYGVMFYDYKTDEKNCKIILHFEQMAFHKEHCIIINRQEDGQYFCQLCNNIGTSLDYKVTSVRPKFARVNGMAAVLACEDRYFIWHFVLPKYNSVQAAGIHIPGKSAEFILEEQQRTIEYGTKRLLGGTKDEICAMTLGDTFFLIVIWYAKHPSISIFQAMQVGGIYRVGLADGVITHSYPTQAHIESIKLNCAFNRVAIVFMVEKLPFKIQIHEFSSDLSEMSKKYSVSRKEIWEYEWDQNDENMLAFKDRNKVFIYDGTAIVEQSNVNGTMTSFKNLVVTAVSFEKFLLTPENPSRHAVQEFLVKAKQDVSALINTMKLEEAIDYAERNPHAELWHMIALYALFRHEFDCAEHAFVQLGDFAGIQLVKKLRNIPTNELRNAEINAYRDEDLENARKQFLECDRKDLAVEMFKKVSDYSAVYELIEKDDDEEEKASALRHIAENHYEMLEWDEAAENFAACGDKAMQIECLVNGNLFGELEVLARNLADESPHLEAIGDAFTTRGMGDQAVECFLRCKNPEKALKVCMELNQWQKANFIAEANHMENVEGLLGKYAIEMKGESDEKSLSALSLYMRAERHLDAAKIVFDIAKDRQRKYMPYEELKQCYVLGAILVEQHRQTLKQLRKIDKNNIIEEAIDDETGLSAEQSRILENTWKGAEAFHFMLLAQQHFFEEKIEDALQTSVILSDYEEFLDPAEVHQMIAMAAANVKQFGICSKAMMRLESFEEFEETDKEMMRNLSFRLFSKYPPTNPKAAKVPCPSCETRIDPYDLQCPECQTKFPICIASGRLIIDNVFWLCPRCKHRAHQHEIIKFSFCPLCHDVESFKKP